MYEHPLNELAARDVQVIFARLGANA